MSKYVRTKSGRILTPIGYDSRLGDIYDGDETKSDEVVDQSDTIKELCDEFVLRGIDIIILNKDSTQYRLGAESVWHDITDTQIRIGVYGAIWTDKGLIYVAKMNEQGELELI